ncbi:hypothetical protein [Fredinandcohnia quinoae]|uniref:Uncharacterized protein n=1 Tax=Fredinandcohnia quinoae TaxID=2918902 RepID=A0AAW5ECX2_9BACI|nr:hypothetical protein [Fredinandcohnia sp. SECRCQ15]MCH1627906.1 hypothetical protein [Fredinandcohnia sp. SECRCQ15]
MERKVYLLLTDTGTLFTKTIKLFTKKPYNHASISLDRDLNDVYSFGRKKPRNPFIGGFVKENLQAGLFKEAKCAIYSCTISEDQFEKMIIRIKQIEEQKQRYKYNLLGLFAVAINKEFKRENAYFCSQFVATVLNDSCVIQIRKPLSLVTPHDLLDSSLFQLVYQGNLADYLKDNFEDEDIMYATVSKNRSFIRRMWSM